MWRTFRRYSRKPSTLPIPEEEARVLFDVPIDVQNAKFDFSYPESVSLRTYKPTVKGHIIQIKKVIAELSKAKMPLICVGGGVLLSEARDEVRAFAEKYQIPVVSTMMGPAPMPTDIRSISAWWEITARLMPTVP